MFHHFFTQNADRVAPTFRLFERNALNGVHNLDPNLTINGTTVAPVFRYKGGDASATGWPAWDQGVSLVKTTTGTEPTFNIGSPLLGPDDDAVKFNLGVGFLGPDTSFGDITTEDFVVEFVFRAKSGSVVSFQKLSASGWQFFYSGSSFRFFISDGTNSASQTLGTVVDDCWYHAIVFVNRDEASTNGFVGYLNGIAGTGADPSALNGNSLAVPVKLSVGVNFSEAFPFDGAIAYMALWKQASWHAAGAAGPTEWATIAQERFNKLIGTHPQVAKGTIAPTTQTRATTAYLDKLENNNTTRKLYRVGDNWMRIVSRLDTNGDLIRGFLAEESATNLFLQSEDLSVTWAPLEAGDTIGGSVVVPNKFTSTTSGIIGSSVSAIHGVSQSVTLTADTYTISAFFKKGAQAWGLIWNNTLTQVRAWYDLTNGVVGTQGTSNLDASIEDWGDGWYRCSLTFTGTAAAHDIYVQPANADGVTTFTGDGVTVDGYAWGLQIQIFDIELSYIPTTTTLVTQNADNLIFKADDGNIGGTGSDLKGAIFLSFLLRSLDLGVVSYAISISRVSDINNRLGLFINGTKKKTTAFQASTEMGALVQLDGTTLPANGKIYRVKHVWQTNSVKLFVDGQEEGTEVTSVIPPNSLTQIEVARATTTTRQFNGIISNLRIFKKPTSKT